MGMSPEAMTWRMTFATCALVDRGCPCLIHESVCEKKKWSHVGGCSQEKKLRNLRSRRRLESKRKTLQQAQEALEEATRKNAAAPEACASVEHEIEEEEDFPRRGDA